MIKTYRPGVDDDAIVDIWLKASRLAHPFLGEDFLRREADTIRHTYLPAAHTRTMWMDARPVGFISLLGDQVGGLFLDPAFHGRGLGRALVDDAVTRRGRLELDVFVDNPVGRRFYARYGFVETGRHVDEPTGHPVIRLRYPA